MNTIYKKKQIGWIIIVIFVPVMLSIVSMSFFMKGSTAVAINVAVFITLLVCLFIFNSLTVEIDDFYFRFKFGTGLIRKKYKLSDIESCEPVKNMIISGWGVRRMRDGWLFNVSGVKAVKIKFKNRTERVYVGTAEPEVVVEVLSKLIENSKNKLLV
jgi:hypothetical protein